MELRKTKMKAAVKGIILEVLLLFDRQSILMTFALFRYLCLLGNSALVPLLIKIVEIS